MTRSRISGSTAVLQVKQPEDLKYSQLLLNRNSRKSWNIE